MPELLLVHLRSKDASTFTKKGKFNSFMDLARFSEKQSSFHCQRLLPFILQQIMIHTLKVELNNGNLQFVPGVSACFMFNKRHMLLY